MIVLTTLTAILSLASASPTWGHHGHGEDQLTVSTTSGHVTGKIDHSLPNVRQFLGIPFAKPAVGDLRWAAPESLSQPNAHINATELPPSCNQYLGTSASLYTRDVLEFNLQGLNQTGSTSEDCLTASVWTPVKHHYDYRSQHEGKNGSLPVLIFIYGGGYSTGGQDVPYQIPAQWVDRSPNHIVVSFNYRLNIFGFPNSKDGPTNFGLLDQRVAVEWCKTNIAAFGGDPERMVLWGQSAGAGSVDFYNYAHARDPIVKGLIMDSGTALLPSGADRTGDDFSYVASQVGCAGLGNGTAAELACMRKVPASTIENFLADHANSGANPGLSFGPIPDGKTIFSNYTERALSGNLAKIPAIIGTNAQDGVPFVTYKPNGPTNQTAVEQALLTTFFCPATETLHLRQQAGLPVYRYLYSGNFTNISPKPWMGAYHSAELPLLMGTDGNFRGHSTQLEEQTSVAMQDPWVAFASDPETGLKGQDWEAYKSLGSSTVRDFGDGVAAKDISLESEENKCNGAVPK